MKIIDFIKKTKYILVILAILLIFLLDFALSIKNAKTSEKVSIFFDNLEIEKLSLLKVYRLTPNDKVFELGFDKNTNIWEEKANSYYKKIWLAMPDSFKEMSFKIKINIGDNTFIFDKNDFFSSWQKIDVNKINGIDSTYIVYQSPENVKYNNQITFLKNIINFTGELNLINLSFKKHYLFFVILIVILICYIFFKFRLNNFFSDYIIENNINKKFHNLTNNDNLIKNILSLILIIFISVIFL